MARKKTPAEDVVIDTKAVTPASGEPRSPVDTYWTLRFEELKEALEANNFEVFIADTAAAAGALFMDTILPTLKGAKTVSFGGSMTLVATGVVDAVRANPDLEVIDTFDTSLTREEVLARRRLSLLADVFLTGTNAVTECGKLVNLDMIGNRVGGINYGPNHVVLFIGRNKVVDTVQDAMTRIKEYVAPVNAMRLNKKTPCRQTSRCMDCSSPDRICNVWTITEKSFPKGRIRIVLINEDAGF
ncbi:lactate utilization protein [Desulfovibrio subterraneus]|jgi:hypothetical protein|uniref:LUD domain-containing protein n=1 Tax=Desulfovibrio subterraneus TaxID=2718620 RepID=A0A7J0BK98_9BACT|nr:lactate utilization protein [Desulfovibrio subterraneus]WBF67763.1 lactate utilization protein [Desulfovibrio subterraneus]GFM33602.1 hypothetical protein DSM101010T_19670 [Desulfovibrio subterraneus]